MDRNSKNLDEQMQLLAERMRNADNRSPWVVCKKRYEEFVLSVKEIKESLDTKRVSITIEQEGQYGSIGNITILGKDITPTNSQKFAQALSTASIVHVFPRIDGLVECDITHYGITNRV